MSGSEKAVQIPSGEGCLEGRLQVHEKARGCALITHPHPLYGGNMGNPVVRQIQGACFEAGFTTLRFNFRGTGLSSGEFDDGVGEQEDVRNSFAFLDNAFGLPFLLAGYSFGSWVNALLLDSGFRVQDHVMVSPPVAFISFSSILQIPNTCLVVTGREDDIAPPRQVEEMMHRCGITAPLEVIEAGDHFYSASALPRLKEILLRHLTS